MEHHRYKVVIRRSDGTPWTVEHCKHVLRQGNELVMFKGEHDVDREVVRVDMSKIDHYNVHEEN